MNHFFKKMSNLGSDFEVKNRNTELHVLIHFTPFKTYFYVADHDCFTCDSDGVEFEDRKKNIEYMVNGNYVCLLLEDEAQTPSEKIKKVLEQYSLSETDVVVIEIFERDN